MSQFHAVWMIVNVREVTAGALCLEAASHDRSCSSLSHPGFNGADSRLLQILIRSPAPGEVVQVSWHLICHLKTLLWTPSSSSAHLIDSTGPKCCDFCYCKWLLDTWGSCWYCCAWKGGLMKNCRVAEFLAWSQLLSASWQGHTPLCSLLNRFRKGSLKKATAVALPPWQGYVWKDTLN